MHFAKASRLFGLQPSLVTRLDGPRLADAIQRISGATPLLRGPLVRGLLDLLGSPEESWDRRLVARLEDLVGDDPTD